MKSTINMKALENTFTGLGFGPVVGIAEQILMRMERNTTEELLSAMDDELIYTEDLWDIMKYYCTPQSADLDEALDAFTEDLLSALSAGALEIEDEDEDEE